MISFISLIDLFAINELRQTVEVLLAKSASEGFYYVSHPQHNICLMVFGARGG